MLSFPWYEQEDEVEVTANSVHPGPIATNLFRHHIILKGIYTYYNACALIFCLWKKIKMLWLSRKTPCQHAFNYASFPLDRK